MVRDLINMTTISLCGDRGPWLADKQKKTKKPALLKKIKTFKQKKNH